MSDEVRYRLLDEPLLSVSDVAGRQRCQLSLPELYAALVAGNVGDFPALRPHQRHVWHAFLVQVAALALHRAGRTELPGDATVWRELLLALTPDDSDGAAWSLVAPPKRPALLQPPVPGGDLSELKNVVDTPDALDMLVTAKNHDVKRSTLTYSGAEHWLFALVSLQTQEGFLGAGNYGISRMNGGFANRPGFGISPADEYGGRVVRDVRRLLTTRSTLLHDYTLYPTSGGIGLVWLASWDGRTSLSLEALDPFYVEICRRVRLVDTNGIRALTAGSAVARVNGKAFNGRTGDPWTPLMTDGDNRKAFTADAGGFTYKRLVPLLFPAPGDSKAPLRAPLQEWAADDAENGLRVVARAVVRGQGKTEGLHERRIAVSKFMRPFLGPAVASDEGARIASERVEDAGTFARKVLFAALMTVYTASPSANERKRDDDTAKSRAGSALSPFDRQVDATFFSELDAELASSGDPEAQRVVRAAWLQRLHELGRLALADALAAAPTAAMRHYRTRVRARARFDAAFRRHFAHRLEGTPSETSR